MTQEQKDVILQFCNQIEELDITNIVLNFNVTKVGLYNIEVFDSLTNRVFKQLSEELQNGIGIFLPTQYNYQNEFGSGNLETDLQNFFTYVQNVQYYTNCESILNRLVYYQVANGFWDKGQRKIYPTNEVKARDVQIKVTNLEKVINSELGKVQIEKKNLIDFIQQKTIEVQQIERNLNASDNNSTQISTLLNQSTSTNEKINSILTQQSTKLDETKTLLEEQKIEYNKLLTDYDSVKKQYKEDLTELESKQVIFKEYLKFVEDKKAYFEERNKYLDDLIGREVGASLFETFKQRKNELEKPVNFWKWAVPAMAVITVTWIAFLFRNFATETDMIQKYILLGLNTLKTIPALILTYFAINQYRKERNFQEEYAFKSAVALTISEYANKLNTAENKDKLIMDSVNSVFLSPIEKKINKEMNMSTFNETLKTLKDGIVDISEKIKK
ncbi:hypothetical protein MW871_15150 [Flavobacterium sp. I-SCBP12n]|uniref:Uncharacterized protein n=1 Tax=Flavobacterium pygoscelis TaxID=2893176 RepID=A0A9X1XV02_9FLAO|nr:hypothetical protein [Flavobacterium pygoscelis]MCK8143226.1 hypothetical protein [Flavobacterium pygoscelis]